MGPFAARDIVAFFGYFRSMNARALLPLLLFAVCLCAAEPERLPNTVPFLMKGDVASNLVAQVDLFLTHELSGTQGAELRFWNRDRSSPEAYERSIETNRARLAKILGVRDGNVGAAQRSDEFGEPIRVATALDFTIFSVRSRAFADVTVEALVLWPEKPIASIIAIPDADVSPEQLAGIEEGLPKEAQYARILAQSGCIVAVPVLINRKIEQRRNSKLTNREFLYRPAYELGRHLIGYELLKIRALIDRLKSSPVPNENIGVIGWGEGGMLALYTAALDTRVKTTVVSGYFDNRNGVWREPIDRNVFGYLKEFGDAEVAAMVAPRTLIIEAARAPEVTIPPKLGGGPGRITTPDLKSVRAEVKRARDLVNGLTEKPTIELVTSGDGMGPYLTLTTLRKFLDEFAVNQPLVDQARDIDVLRRTDAEARMESQIHEIDRHNQWLLMESAYTRAEFMKNLDFSSPEKYAETSAKYRQYFYDEVIGRFDRITPSGLNPESRLIYDKPLWKGYEIGLWTFPEFGSYGILLLPKDIKPGEKRPVVVCQHGLEGRPQDVVEGDKAAYHDYAAKLAERGFVVFAPQNLYIFGDRFRVLQRKLNPLGKTLFSIITPQHQQIIDWLKTLPYVDSKRIAFYGLSYGGKTAMRVPALLTDYCLSICSADFNEWVWKNASTRSPNSYFPAQWDPKLGIHVT